MTEAEWLACSDPYLMLTFLKQGQATWGQRFAAWFGLGHGRGHSRRLLLFSCGCCRRIWPLLADERSRSAIEVCERFVDGHARKKEFCWAGAEAGQAAFDAESPRLAHGPWLGAAQARAAEAVAAIFELHQGPDKGGLWAREAARAVGKGARGDLICGRRPPIDIPQEIWFPTQPWVSSSAVATRMPDSEALAGEAAWLAEGKFQCGLLRDIFGNPFLHPPPASAWQNPEVERKARKIYDEHAFDQMPVLADALEKAGCSDRDIIDHCRNSETHVRGCWAVDRLLGIP